MKLSSVFFTGAFVADAFLHGVAAFSASHSHTVNAASHAKNAPTGRPAGFLYMTEKLSTETAERTKISSRNDEIRIPLSFEEMVNQVSNAMEDAYKQGKTRQILRVLLPRSASNDQLLQYYEDDAQDGDTDIVLAPTDETWQGGIMQLYRSASYTTQGLLRYVMSLRNTPALRLPTFSFFF